MARTNGLDASARLRYLGHLVEAEGVSRREAEDFLDVVHSGLREGTPEATALVGEIEARMAVAEGYVEAAGATTRLGEAEAATDAMVAALVHLSHASDSRATPARARSLQDYAARNLRAGEGAA